MATYTSTIQGIPVTSNYDSNASQPSGSTYTYVLNFTSNFMATLAQGGLDIVDFLSPNLLASSFGNNGHTITNALVTRLNQTQVQIRFTATSPTIAEAVTIIIGIVLTLIGGPIGAALGIILIFVGAIGLVISSIIASVNQPAAKGSLGYDINNYIIPLTCVGLAIGGIWVAYSILSSKKVREKAKVQTQQIVSAGSKRTIQILTPSQSSMGGTVVE